MDRKDRISIIEALEKERKSKVIVYFTGDRQPKQLFATQIALDVVELFYQHLKKIGKNKKKISLCISSNGGNLNAPWPLVYLIREYCDEFEVLVPYKALSAATLVALGANKIVMPTMGQLSPVDPEGHFKIENKNIDLSVEDIIGFIDLAKQKIGISEQISLTEILKSLVGEVNPSILGAVNRTHSLIRRLAQNLLRLHLKKADEGKQIKEIVEHLTQKLFSHEHFINRCEAKDIVGFGKIIEEANGETERLLDKILDVYCYEELKTNEVFNPLEILGTEKSKDYEAKRAFIESKELCHVYETSFTLTKTDETPQPNINLNWQGWKKYEEVQ